MWIMSFQNRKTIPVKSRSMTSVVYMPLVASFFGPIMFKFYGTIITEHNTKYTTVQYYISY